MNLWSGWRGFRRAQLALASTGSANADHEIVQYPIDLPIRFAAGRAGASAPEDHGNIERHDRQRRRGDAIAGEERQQPRVLAVLRIEVLFDGLLGDIDQPGFRYPGCGVAGQLFAPVVFARRVGDFDHKEDGRGRRVLPRIALPRPRPGVDACPEPAPLTRGFVRSARTL